MLGGSILLKKSCMYYALLLLLFLNFVLLSFIYFFFLREFNNGYGGYQPKMAQEQISQSGEIIKEKFIEGSNRSFRIDYAHNRFLKDGKPFQYISGSLHYFRVPRQYWRDRLRKFRAAGLNVVCTYVEWSYHEPAPRNYKFSGEQDLGYFLQLAAEEDLLVILRPGPYICAERDFGGFPPWLMTLYPDIQLRTTDDDYKNEVKIWYGELFPKLQKHLYGNGGPIIMVQVENEYGSYFACNKDYMGWLRDLTKSHVKDTSVLFTTDGQALSFLKCGTVSDVYATVDFGTTVDVESAFSNMRQIEKQGPLVNSEFYPGWLSHWEEPLQTINTSNILSSMEGMFRMNASFNFYMFFGGTNFGFTSGANFFQNYQPQLTSYDYDAPLTEAGDPTEKYYAIRQLISKYVKIPDIPIPEPTPKGAYGIVTLQPIISLFNNSYIPDMIKQVSDQPKTFEELGVMYGYTLYETIIPSNIPDPSLLYVSEVRDRIIVYVDQIPRGILSRSRKIDCIPLIPESGKKLSLLVENQGRINYGSALKDKKGLLDAPLLDGRILHGWTMKGFPFTSVAWVEKMTPSNNHINAPAFYYGELVLPSKLSDPLDTYVDLTGWGKGIIFINDFNLGRYWPGIGSQVTLYVPGCYLKAAPIRNKIVVFETEIVSARRTIKFVAVPNIDRIPPSIGRSAF